MKKNFLSILYFALIIFFFQSCGIHRYVHNPKRPGKLPVFSKEEILLGELTKFRTCFDVFYYDLSVNIDPLLKSLSGTVEIHSVAETDFDTLQIDLHPNFKINKLVDNTNERELPYNREERAVFIRTTKKKGEKFVLKIEYKGSPIIAKKPPWRGGFVWKKGKKKFPWIGVACESDGASIWWPLKDHTSDEPDSMRLHYSVPKDLVAVGNGIFEGKENKDTYSTYNWFVSYPINTYNVTVNVGNYKMIEDTFSGINDKKVALNYYVLPKNYEKAKSHFKQVHSILKIYEKRFGEYPWNRDGFKLIESPFAGMEHQSAIAYGNGYKNDVNVGTDYIILHEAAHEWWGNSITAKDLADVWIQEGFATYAEALYLEAKEGKNAYLTHLLIERLFIKNKYPVVGVRDRRWFDYKKGADVYMKGAWILHTLRNQINYDSLFFDIIESFAKKFKYKIVESKDFIDHVNIKTGQDYNWFFNRYLYVNTVPELEFAAPTTGTFYYRWSNVPSDFNKLKVRLKTAKGIILLVPTIDSQSLTLPRDKFGVPIYEFDFDVLIAFKKVHYKSLIK